MPDIYDIDFDDFGSKLTPWLLRDAEFYVSDGDVAYGDSLEQDVYFILNAGKGNFYQSPRIGFNLRKKINSNINKVQLRRQVIDTLKEDGIKVQKVEIITVGDINRLNITDPELINRIKQDKMIISIEAQR